VVAVVLQEASLKMEPNQSLKCVMFQYVRCRKSKKSASLNVIHHRGNPIERHGSCASSLLPDLAPFLFWELKLALKGRRCDGTIQEQSPVLCSPNSAEDGDIFIGDRALEECPLCRSECGCWSATSVETSVYDLIDMH